MKFVVMETGESHGVTQTDQVKYEASEGEITVDCSQCPKCKSWYVSEIGRGYGVNAIKFRKKDCECKVRHAIGMALLLLEQYEDADNALLKMVQGELRNYLHEVPLKDQIAEHHRDRRVGEENRP